MTRVHSDAEGVSVPTCDGETIGDYTPGPWKVFLVEKGPKAGQLLGVGQLTGEGVTDAHGGLWGSGGEKLANAYLIAAAPDLLAFANAFDEWAGRVIQEGNWSGECVKLTPELHEAWHTLSVQKAAAVAKAKGATA